ncbi:MAG: hypothetical protein Q7J16_05030 [Candidatus Cloacimonadales bacterium]|nr:hypothetical protein [Candidatus Cloacimonadales bacterium]
MKKKLIISLLIFISSFLLAAEIITEHNPIIIIDTGTTLNLQLDVINGFSEINKVYVLYRQQGEITYNELEMEKGSESETQFTAKLDDTVNYQSGVEYFFHILDINNLYLSLPEFQPENNPFRVAISQPVKEIEGSGFVLLSPDPEYSDFANDFMIAISFFAIKDKIDPTTIQLLLDGKDVTAKSRIYSNMIIYNVVKAHGGMHMYKVTAGLKDGTEVESETWKVSIADYSLKKKLNLTGKASFNSYYSTQQYDAADTLDLDNKDKWANFLLQFKGEYKWLRFSSKIFLSSLESKHSQAVNRYNLSFFTKYFDFIAGDYTPNYGTFMMSGKNIMGVHSNLHLANFRLKTTYGVSKRAVEFGNGTYTRNSLGIRTEVGNEDNFVWGFAVAKNKDDKNSISDIYYHPDNDPDIDDEPPLVTPDDNIIIGTDFTWSLFRKRLLLGAEAALSYLNTNIYDGALSAEELKDSLDVNLPFNPQDFEAIFVLNENIEPIQPGFSSLAYKTYLRTFFYNNFLNINYSAVGTSFNSYSSNYLQKDNAILSVNDNVNLFNNKLFLSLNLNLTSDNLYDEKDVTTKSTNYSTQAFYRFGSQAYVKIGYMNNDTANDDSLLFEYTTQNINFGCGYFVKNIAFAPTRFSFVYNNYNSTGKNEPVYSDSLIEFESKKDNINFSMNSEFVDLPLETTISYTSSVEDGLNSSTNYQSIFLKGLFSFYNKKLLPYANLQYTMFGGDIDKNSFSFNVGTNYYLKTNTFLSTNIGTKVYTDNDVSNGSADYSLFTWRLKISQNF